MLYRRKRKIYCTLEEINQHLKLVYQSKRLLFREKKDGESFRNSAFIVDRLKNFELSYKWGEFRATYIFNKANGDTDDHQQIDGTQAFRMLCKMAKVNKLIHNKTEAPFSAGPLLYRNEKYNATRNKAISYDMNSAYSWAMLQPQPDTSKPPKAKKIGKDEVGFDLLGNIKREGYSLYVFKLIESPFKHFVEHYYKLKQKAKTKSERRKAKEYLNFSVGYLQGKDPYTRANIIGLCNERIKSLIDENTLYANTDSIVSLVERPDLELGDDIGQWKVEHRGMFAYIDFSYQWNDDTPSVRGKPKEYFSRGFDLLKDELPDTSNIYRFNREKGAIVYEKKTRF